MSHDSRPLGTFGRLLLLSAGVLVVPLSALAQTPRDLPAGHARAQAVEPSAKLHPALLQRLDQADGPVKAWVFFTDKGMRSPQEYDSAIKRLAATYNPRAIHRRALRGANALRGGELFDEHDLPVVAAYVDAVTAAGARVHIISRWLNAVSVWATREQLEQIAGLGFVSKLQPVARRQRVDVMNVQELGRGPFDGGSGPARSPSSVSYGLSEEQLEQINLIALHDAGFTGAGVVVGILDTGFKRSHQAFNWPGHTVNVIAEYDFVDNDPNAGYEPGDPYGQYDHGTMILGCIGAYRPSMLVGGAYDAAFILCKTEDTTDEYPAEEDNYVAGLEFIEFNGGDMVTSSLGYIDWYTQEDLDGQTAVTTIAVNLATADGVHCCTAAGNEYHDSDPGTSHLIAPSDAYQVIACGAVDSSGAIAYFSSDGPSADGRVKPELLARGISTYTVSPSYDDTYTTADGTSLSTPLVACAVACLIQVYPDWTPDQMRDAMFHTADYYVAHGTHDPLYVRGYGIVNAYAVGLDCNGNGVPDVTDIATGASKDCQPNGIPDECDIADGPSEDCNGNGVPDECDLVDPPPQIVDDWPAVLGWVEISGTGTSLGLSDDGEAAVTMPFSNETFSTGDVQVGNNGGIGFGGDLYLPHNNAPIPASTPFGGMQALFPFWDDLDSDTGDVYYETIGAAPDRTFVVEWYNRPHYPGDSVLDGDEATLQVQVFETPTDGVYAQFLYLDTDFDDPRYDDGAAASIGYQTDGEHGDSWSYRQPGAVNPGVVLSLRSQGQAHSQDINQNGIPDDCECLGDLNGDSFRNVTDFTLFAAAYGSEAGNPTYNPYADLNGDGFVNVTDFTVLASVYGQSCP
jgi:serine protease AprX